MDTLKKVGGTVAAVAAIFLNFAMAGAFTKAVEETLGPPWTYILHFSMGMFFGALALLVKRLAAYVRMENKPTNPGALFRWKAVRWLTGRYLLQYAKWELDHLRKYDAGWRKWVRDLGALPAAIAASLVIGPILAAFFMRQMGVPELRAWLYVVIAGAITTITMVTGSLGIIDAVWNVFVS